MRFSRPRAFAALVTLLSLTFICIRADAGSHVVLAGRRGGQIIAFDPNTLEHLTTITIGSMVEGFPLITAHDRLYYRALFSGCCTVHFIDHPGQCANK